MGDDIGSGLVCFGFCCGATLHCWVCLKRKENDLKRQSITEPEPMSSPINYPAYLDPEYLFFQIRSFQVGTVTWLQHFSKLSPKTRDLPEIKGIHAKIPILFSIGRQIGISRNTDLVSYLKKNDYLSFSFIRHPFDRLVSAYREKVEKQDHGLYVRSKLKNLYGNFGFDTFLKHVINTYKIPNKCDNYVHQWWVDLSCNSSSFWLGFVYILVF